MSLASRSVADAAERLSRRDSTLKSIKLHSKHHTDEQLAELADCLLAHPDVVTHVYLGRNRLTDETGVKLARYLAASSTIKLLSLNNNQFGLGTYLALAAALRVNTSLQDLNLGANQAVDRTGIDAAFVDALRLNFDRPADSFWWLYSSSQDYKRLKGVAEQLGHPSLQLLLASTDDRPTAALRLRAAADAVERLNRHDQTLVHLSLLEKSLTDEQLAELVDCLLAHPDIVVRVWLGRNQLTDETGVKLARYLAASSTVQLLSLDNNQFGSGTYLALAAALRANTSLWALSLVENLPVDRTRIDAAFVEALRFNPHRSGHSMWTLYSSGLLDVDFERLKLAAEQLGHPSLRLLLTSIAFAASE